MNNDMVAYTNTYKGFNIEILYDQDSENPRKAFDQMSVISAVNGSGYHRGDFDLGPNDLHVTDLIGAISIQLPESEGAVDIDEFYEWDNRLTEKDYAKYLIEQFSNYAYVLPVFIQEHGSVEMYTGSSAAELNVDMKVFISIPKHIVQQEWIEYVDDPKKLEKAAFKHMQSDIEIYGAWKNGDTYIYSVEDPKGYIDTDTCAGFYGLGACIDGAKEAINGWMWKERHDSRLIYIRARIHQKMIAAKYLFFPTVVTTA